MRALIRKRRGLLQLSEFGDKSLPRSVLEDLESVMRYNAVFQDRGDYNPLTGSLVRTYSEPRLLFTYDSAGLFVCQKGYLPRVSTMLSEAGYEVFFQDLDPAVDDSVYLADWERVLQTFEFRPLQEQCLIQVDCHDGGIIDASPAFGKSYVIPMLCCLYPHAKIDVVTKWKSVADTLHQRLTRYIPNVGLVRSGKKYRGRVTVYTADSLHHSDFSANIVLADEVHELMTDNYVAKLSRYENARMYGFTATRETRFDNHHMRMEGLFGPAIFEMDYQTGVSLGLVVPINVYWHDVILPYNPVRGVRDPVRRKREGIWHNAGRNQIIAASVAPYVDDQQQVLIAVETIDHAVHLKQYLPHFTLCYSDNGLDIEQRERYVQQGLIPADEPEMTAARREMLRCAFERRELLWAIATPIWSTGVSFDSLNVQVRAEGSQSETKNVQVPGRVCRISPGTDKQCGVVIDFMDCFDEGYRNASLSRWRAYHKQGWTQYHADGRLFERNSRMSRGRSSV